jgi:hypothetical protein
LKFNIFFTVLVFPKQLVPASVPALVQLMAMVSQKLPVSAKAIPMALLFQLVLYSARQAKVKQCPKVKAQAKNYCSSLSRTSRLRSLRSLRSKNNLYYPRLSQ